MIRWMQGILVGAAVALAMVAILMVRWSGGSVNADAGRTVSPSAGEQLEWAGQGVDDVARNQMIGDGVSGVESAASLAADGHVAVSTVAASAPAASAARSAAPASPLDEKEPGQSRQERLLAKLESQFADEAVDEFWSTQTGDRITGFFAEAASSDEGNGSQLGDVQCHSSLCRVEVVHDSEQALQQFALTFPMQMAEALPRITYQTEPRNDGRLAMVMYLSSGVETH